MIGKDAKGRDHFDFENIIPMPSHIRNTSCDYSDAEAQYRDNSIENEEEGRKTICPLNDEERSLGAGEGWYRWSIRNWCTKWNSYHFKMIADEQKRLEFTFDTAWNFPELVFVALAARFPKLMFDCACFDDGWSYAGMGQFNGRKPFHTMEATDELHERVYGFPPKSDDEAA